MTTQFLNKKKIKTVMTNIAVWLLLMLTSIIELNNSEATITLSRFNIPMWTSSLLIFYLCYLILIPKYLFRKRYLLYGLFTLLLITSSFIAVKTWVQFQKIAEIENYLSEHKSTNNRDENQYQFKDTPKDRDKRPFPHTSPEGNIDKSKFFTLDNYLPLDFRNVGIFYTMLITLAVALILRSFERTKHEEQRAISLEKEKVSSELEYLKQQINPHFLFNALNSIYSLTLLQSDKSPDAVLRLSSILRYMLYETDKEKVKLSSEIEIIEDYLSLQALRLTNKTKINFMKLGDFDPYLIEPMFLIPLIENAFKYGVDTVNSTDIDIAIKIDKNRLLFSCTNQIIRQNGSNKNSGIGIKNIQRRLELLFEDRYKFETKTEDNQFKVKLIIPLDME